MTVVVEPMTVKRCVVAEGPHWDHRTGQLLFVDIGAKTVHRWTAATEVDEQHTFGEDSNKYMSV